MFAHCQSLKDPGVLRHDSHQLFYARRYRDPVHAKNIDRSRRGQKFARQLPEKSSLACAVRAEDRNDFAGSDLQSDPTICFRAIAITLDEITNANRRGSVVVASLWRRR